MDVLIWAAIGYAVGAVQFAYVAAALSGHKQALDRVRRSVGEDDAHLVLKESGAGKLAVAAGVGDVLKAFVPILVAVWVAGPYAVGACVVGAVAGHCWPPVLRHLAGRGLSAAAGAFLAFLPVEMVAGGLVTAGGSLAGFGGLASTIGFAAVPVLAVLRGQPDPYPFAAAAVVVLVLARRLEGVTEDVHKGVAPVRAVVRRAIFDVSAVREERRAAGEAG